MKYLFQFFFIALLFGQHSGALLVQHPPDAYQERMKAYLQNPNILEINQQEKYQFHLFGYNVYQKNQKDECKNMYVTGQIQELSRCRDFENRSIFEDRK